MRSQPTVKTRRTAGKARSCQQKKRRGWEQGQEDPDYSERDAYEASGNQECPYQRMTHGTVRAIRGWRISGVA